jgi:putative membrane protein
VALTRDQGLQPERTELAWRRTALAIAIGSLLSLRVFPLALPQGSQEWGLVPGVVGVTTACVLWVAARGRQRRTTAALTSHTAGPLPDARLLLFLTMFATGFGVLAVALVVVAHGS